LTDPLGEGVVVDLSNISRTILSLSSIAIGDLGDLGIRRRYVAVEAPTGAMAILR
jgi:acetylglutamate synthase